jgi:predicted dehydrogenase
LIPAFKVAGVRLKSIASNGGVSAVHAGRKFRFEESTTATDAIFADPSINAVVIATRHHSHAELVCKAVRAGKHVFVEKPLALTTAELAEIQAAFERTQSTDGNASPPDHGPLPTDYRLPILMVGFNRRFALQIKKMKSLLDTVREPKAFVMTVNAGVIPPEHWIQDPSVGGGRILGEACHFIDLLRHLAGSPITSYETVSIGTAPGLSITEDKATILLRFKDGSMGTIHYLANGHKSFPKERLEAFAGGRILQLDNYRKLKGFGWSGFSKMNLWRQDKGQQACVAAFVQAVEQGGPAPVPFEELIEVSRVAIAISESLR